MHRDRRRLKHRARLGSSSRYLSRYSIEIFFQNFGSEQQTGTRSNKRGHCTLRLHNDFTDHLADTTAKVIAKDLSCIFRRNLSKGCVKVEIHCGLPVGCNRRMKVVFRKATSSPSGDHFFNFQQLLGRFLFCLPQRPAHRD